MKKIEIISESIIFGITVWDKETCQRLEPIREIITNEGKYYMTNVLTSKGNSVNYLSEEKANNIFAGNDIWEAITNI